MKTKNILAAGAVVLSGVFASAANASIIAFEAESGTISSLNGGTYEVLDDTNALGGKYVRANSAYTGQINYSVDLAAGTYQLWMKFALTTDHPNNDSVFMPGNKSNLKSGVVDFGAATSYVNSLYVFIDTSFVWACVPTARPGDGVGNYTVVSGGGGPFDFSIRGREYGVKVDALAFVSSDDPMYAGSGTTVASFAQASALDAAVLIPEPATFGIVLSVLTAAILRRRRIG